MLLHPCPQTWLCAKSKAEDREVEMDQKVYSADFSLWQIDINVCNDALQLDIKGLTEGLFSKNIKTEKLEVLLEKDEELQRQAFDFSKSGNKAWNCGVNIRYPGTTKLEDLKVWDGSSEFRPWKSQICISKEFEGPFSHLIRLEIEGVTLKKVNGTCTKNGLWKLKVDLAVTSKLASPLIPIQLMPEGKQTTHDDDETVCGANIAEQFTTQSYEGLNTTKVAEEVNGTCTKNGLWKLKVELAVTSKLASPLIPIQLMSEGKQTTHDDESVCGANIAAQFTTQSYEGLNTTKVADEGSDAWTVEETLGSDAGVDLTHGNPFNGLDMSSDPAKELRPLKEPGTSCDPANAPPDPGNTEMKPFNGLAAPSDLGTNKLKYKSYAEKMIWWLFMILICLSLRLSQAEESCVPEAAVPVGNIFPLDSCETCDSHKFNVQCQGKNIFVCLKIYGTSQFAVGCAPNICINNGCPEWNGENGSYKVQYRYMYEDCNSSCPEHFSLVDWKNCTASPPPSVGTNCSNGSDSGAIYIVIGLVVAAVVVVVGVVLWICWRRRLYCFGRNRTDGEGNSMEMTKMKV